MHRTVSRFSKEKDEISSGTASCTWRHLTGYEEALSYCLRARTKSWIQTCAKDQVMRVMNQNKTTIGSKHAHRLLVEETKDEYPFYVLNSWLTPNRVISSPTIPQKCAAIWCNERDFHNLPCKFSSPNSYAWCFCKSTLSIRGAICVGSLEESKIA